MSVPLSTKGQDCGVILSKENHWPERVVACAELRAQTFKKLIEHVCGAFWGAWIIYVHVILQNMISKVMGVTCSILMFVHWSI